jgi:hypothetical protein
MAEHCSKMTDKILRITEKFCKMVEQCSKMTLRVSRMAQKIINLLSTVAKNG